MTLPQENRVCKVIWLAEPRGCFCAKPKWWAQLEKFQKGIWNLYLCRSDTLNQNVLRNESHIKEWRVWDDVLVPPEAEVKYHSRALMAKNRLLFKPYTCKSVFWDEPAE